MNCAEWIKEFWDDNNRSKRPHEAWNAVIAEMSKHQDTEIALLRKLLGEALIPLAVIKLQDERKPYKELSREFIESIKQVHDAILAERRKAR